MTGVKNILQQLKKKYNLNYSNFGFYRAGIRFGFLVKDVEKNRYILDKVKFKEWTSENLEKVPEGYVSLDELSKILKVSRAQAAIISRRDGVVKILKSTNKKKKAIYVELSSVRKVLQRDKKSYDWV